MLNGAAVTELPWPGGPPNRMKTRISRLQHRTASVSERTGQRLQGSARARSRVHLRPQLEFFTASDCHGPETSSARKLLAPFEYVALALDRLGRADCQRHEEVPADQLACVYHVESVL